MKKLLIIFSAIGSAMMAQVIPNKDYVAGVLNNVGLYSTGNVSVVDNLNGYIYTCGYVNTASAGKDLFLAQFDFNGNQQWMATYDFNSLDDVAKAVTVDGSGNVYVTGYSYQTSTNPDIITIKYNSSGAQQWATRFNGTANGSDDANDILVDGSGNTWVCGYSTTTGRAKDFLLLKLSPTGVVLATPKKNGSANSDDIAYKMVLNGSNIIATGMQRNTTTNNDILTLSYNISTALPTWTNGINGSANGDDVGLDIRLDGTGVFICGSVNNTSTGDDYYFARLRLSTGVTTYSNVYNAHNGTDIASALVPDELGNYAVTGLVQNGSNYEYHTPCYDTSSLKWTHVQPINGSYNTTYPKIAMDTIAQHFYVCGTYLNSTYDGLLYQIDPTGTLRWAEYHDGVNSARDVHTDLVLDGYGRVYLSSNNETATTNVYDVKLIRYSQTPVYMPVNYNMQADTFSMAHLYYSNSGQIKDTAGNSVPEVLFYANFAAPREYILQNKVAFVEEKVDSINAVVRNDTLSRIDMIFAGANEFSKIYPIDFQDTTILNYFIADTVGLRVRGASHLICPNIYPLIDLHYSSNEQGCKYYFVVKPGGDPSSIRLMFQGATSTTLTGNDLQVASPFSSWKFKKPDIYYVSVPSFTNLTITTTSVTGTNGWVSMGSNTYSINPGTYDPSWPLVIEIDMGKATSPSSLSNINWSTYFGGSGDQSGYGIQKDNSNNIYIGGVSTTGVFPTTTGAFQTTMASSDPYNGVLMKFSSARSLLWATYFGGTDIDEIKDISFDKTNTLLYGTGYTFSADFPNKVKTGASSSPSYSGVTPSAYIAEFDPSNGFPTWTFLIFGATNTDSRAWSISVDPNGTKYVGGEANANLTQVSSGSHYVQSSYGGGNSDGFIAKFSSADVNLWTTWYGGSGDDAILGVEVDSNNDLYIFGTAGATIPTLDPSISGELYTSSFSGGFSDWFFGKFDNTGQRKWVTLHGGSGDESIGNNCLTTIGTNVFFFGTTNSTSLLTKQLGSTPIQSYAGNNDCYIIQLNNSFNVVWATYHGGTDNDLAFAINKDLNNNVYVTGGTYSTDFPVKTSVGYYSQSYQGFGGPSQTTTEGGDAFISAFSSTTKNLLWSTYIGGGGLNFYTGQDAIYDLCFTSNLKLFVTGGTSSRSPVYPSFNPGSAFYSSPASGFGQSDMLITEFNISSPVGIKENSFKKNHYIVFPNPTKNYIYIGNLSNRSSVRLYDITGKLVASTNCDDSNTEINMDVFSAGIYLLILEDEKGNHETYKVVKVE